MWQDGIVPLQHGIDVGHLGTIISIEQQSLPNFVFPLVHTQVQVSGRNSEEQLDEEQNNKGLHVALQISSFLASRNEYVQDFYMFIATREVFCLCSQIAMIHKTNPCIIQIAICNAHSLCILQFQIIALSPCNFHLGYCIETNQLIEHAWSYSNMPHMK